MKGSIGLTSEHQGTRTFREDCDTQHQEQHTDDGVHETYHPVGHPHGWQQTQDLTCDIDLFIKHQSQKQYNAYKEWITALN